MSNLNLKNFAKINDSDFDIKDITVFAGKPGSGKSYIMKFQYAYTEAVSSIVNGKYKMQYALMDSEITDQSLLSLIKNSLRTKDSIEMDKVYEEIDRNDYIAAELLLQQFTLDNDPLSSLYKDILKKFAAKQQNALTATDEEKFNLIFKNILKSIFLDIDQINDNFEYKHSDLVASYQDGQLKVDSFKIKNEISDAIFVETPLILEFENFLPKERFQVPYHIDSLLQELNKSNFSFTSAETDDFIRKFSKVTESIILGNVSKDSKGFSFESESGKNYNIVNASSGIKSIGLLQYLVSNKALKKGSTLYWEEPEVHLHPTWQLKMVDLFIELMNAGIKVVFSTHSPYMADYLNAKATKGGYRDRVAFNLLSEKDGVVSNTILDDSNWEELQNELLGPLEDIMWQYL